jgi:hypothetical protein
MTARALRASISAGLLLSLSMFAMGVTTFGHPILLPWTALGVLGFYVLMRRRDPPRAVGVPSWDAG